MLSAAVTTEPRGSAGRPQSTNLRSGSRFPRYYAKHATGLIQWLAPNSRRRSSLGRTIDDPGRGANIVHAGNWADVIGEMGLYRACCCCRWRRSRRFSLVALAIGWLVDASALFVATSAARACWCCGDPAARDLDRLRAAFAQRRHRGRSIWRRPASRTMLGGILLVLPGFITDASGAAAARSGGPALARRDASAARSRTARRAADPSVIDLEPRRMAPGAGPADRGRRASASRPRAKP